MRLRSHIICVLSLLALFRSFAEEPNSDYVPKPGEFPPADSSTYLAGELVFLDPVNRRGGLRLDGDEDGRYHEGPLHYFAMLPYGEIYHNGAPAELRDIPVGTHVHGYFFVPPEGEEGTIPPLPEEQAKFAVRHNHAISLEDDFSFYQRRGQGWKVAAIDLERGKIDVVPDPAAAGLNDGIIEPYTFDIDPVSRVWNGRALVDLTDIAPGAEVRFNLAWSPGSRDREFTVSDLWLGEESWNFATELQRRRHIRYQHQRWVPGWIDAVEPNDYGGGTVTVTLFGGMDPSLYEEFKKEQADGFGTACAEKTLRTWFHRADKKIGQVLEFKESANPPTGSSGIQIRMKFAELLDGYRPGAIVRLKCLSWIFVTMPPEERLKSLEDRERSSVLSFP